MNRHSDPRCCENRNSFANAAINAAQLFDGLRAALSNRRLPEVANRAELESILGVRDEISSDLARADAGLKTKLSDLYVRFDRAISINGEVLSARCGFLPPGAFERRRQKAFAGHVGFTVHFMRFRLLIDCGWIPSMLEVSGRRA